MSFVYPAGLWALLALGVFAAVCLIRHRSEVTPVSSTYLWRLSEQRRKKKGYWRTLKRSLFFALQFLALALSALLIAQPIMPMPGSGVNVAVILDASASMQMADGSGQTRFARAVAAAERDMDRLPWGASVTVVLAGDEARVAADHVSGGAELRAALEGVSCGWGARRRCASRCSTRAAFRTCGCTRTRRMRRRRGWRSSPCAAGTSGT